MINEKHYEEQIFENLQYTGESIEDCKFVDCTFVGCTFEDCKLAHCAFSGCSFIKCAVTNLQAEYSQLQFAEFTDCRLIGMQWDKLLPSGRFAEPISKLQGCLLKYNTFTHMNFKKFSFSGGEITDSIFAECQLMESSFKSCKLERTEFFKCDLQKADFRDATGYQMDIMTNRMKGARFSFPEVVNLLNGLGIKIE